MVHILGNTECGALYKYSLLALLADYWSKAIAMPSDTEPVVLGAAARGAGAPRRETGCRHWLAERAEAEAADQAAQHTPSSSSENPKTLKP